MKGKKRNHRRAFQGEGSLLTLLKDILIGILDNWHTEQSLT
jgi:hypothetical protein